MEKVDYLEDSMPKIQKAMLAAIRQMQAERWPGEPTSDDSDWILKEFSDEELKTIYRFIESFIE